MEEIKDKYIRFFDKGCVVVMDGKIFVTSRVNDYLKERIVKAKTTLELESVFKHPF